MAFRARKVSGAFERPARCAQKRRHFNPLTQSKIVEQRAHWFWMINYPEPDSTALLREEWNTNMCKLRLCTGLLYHDSCDRASTEAYRVFLQLIKPQIITYISAHTYRDKLQISSSVDFQPLATWSNKWRPWTDRQYKSSLLASRLAFEECKIFVEWSEWLDEIRLTLITSIFFNTDGNPVFLFSWFNSPL